MTPIDKKYNVDGFCRRTPAPEPPPVAVTGEIIEISSDDDDDSNSAPDPDPDLDRLDNLPLNILRIKREQVVEQLNAINENDSNEIAENVEYELNQDNAISGPIYQNVLNEQNSLQTSLKETGAHGYQTPESLGQASSVIESRGIVDNYPSDEEFLLDLAGSNNTGNNHTKQQMSNISTPKVLFSMKSEKKKKDTPRLPLQNFSENVIQNDDTTQMVPDFNGIYSNQDENFSTENTFTDRFGAKSDLFPQNTPTMYPTHSHQSHETSSTNYNENVKTNHSYNADMNNGDSNQYQYRNPLDNVFFPSNCATPVYPTLEQPSMHDILKAEIAKIKEENEQLRNEERDKERDKVIEDVLKKFEDKGLIVVPRDEYESLKKDRDNNRSNSPHHTTKNGEKSSSKRHSMSPKRHSGGYGSDINSEKRHKSSLHNNRDKASSSSKHIHRHDYHRSSSSSSKGGKSSHKTSTITSGSYRFQNVSNPNAMDYENTSSSDSIPGPSVQPSVEKEKTPPASNPGVQFKYKSGFGKESRFASSSAKTSRNESNHSTQQNHSKFGAHQAYKFTNEQKTRRSVVKNTDKSLYLNSDKAKKCPICHRNYKRMVAHMKTVHEQYEVYVSRLSQSMVDKAKQNAIPVIKYIKPKSTQYVKAMCLFCEEEKDFMPHYWNDHLRSHTGEWGHECRICLKNTCFYTHCGFPTSKLVEFNLYVENLCAFVCRKCNYIQLDETNIQKHMKNEHEMKDPKLNREYDEIKLLPAMKNIRFSRNPHLDGANVSSIPRFFGKTVQPQPKQRAQAPASVHSLSSTSGIMVLENRVIRPAVDTETASTAEIQQHENQHTANDDIEMQNQNESATDDQLLVEMPVQDSNNAYKIDEEEENVLWGTYNNYNQNSIEFNYEVRPWIDDYAKKPAIHLMTQFALYKCMHLKCLYATDNPENWEIHMAKHIDMIDVLGKRLNMDKEIRSTHIKYRECPYCQYEAKANFQTIAHMEQTHCRNAFQCEHCFYRSIEMDNMVLHYEMHHNDKSRKILLCNDEVEFQQSDEEQLKSYCDQNVEKIKCGQEACSEEFVCFNTFWSHLKVVHPNESNTFKCAYCFVDVNCTESDIQKHLKEHKFSEFHCLYCKNGFDDIDQTRAHMSDHHASHFLFIVARRSQKPEEVDEDFQLVHIGNSKNYRDYSMYKCTDPAALELMKPTVLDVQTQYDVLQANQNSVNKAQFFGNPPSMKFGEINDVFFIKYDDYIKIPRYRSSKSVESTSHSVNQASPAKSPEQMIPNVPPQMKITSRHPIKSEFSQVNYDQNQFGSAVASHSSDQPTITYKCISIKEAEDLESIGNRSYKAQLCSICAKFMKIDKETGLNPYISHLMEENDHPCTEFSPSEKYMMQHRIKAHGENSIVYIVKEETANTLVYKLVRCQFECLTCDAKFENVSALKKHHQIHLNRYLRSTVIQNIRVIQSNDPEQLVDSCTEMSQKYNLCNLFWCNIHQTTIGTRLSALKHHNECHPKHNFEYSIKSMLVESNTMETDDHSLYVLECEHCMQLFGSTDSVHAHIERIRNENPNSSDNALYTVKQLLVCPECKIVSTFSGLDAHYSAKHPEKNSILPVHIINNKLCGLCRMEERNANHFERAHGKGEVVGNVLLRKLRMDKADITNCTFAPGCCGEMRFDQITQVINHVSNCKHRCFCNLCPESKFTGANEYIGHRIDMHNENLEEILNNIHNIKNFMMLLSEMRLIFSNGFVVTKKAIENTSIGMQLSKEISKPVLDLFDREKLWFNTFLLLGP